MLKFPARFEPQAEGGYTVTFRDIPEAITEGDSIEEAREMAVDALLTAMDFYVDNRRTVPSATACEAGEELVELPASASAKVLLLNLFIRSGMRPSDLARAMNIKPQEVNRLLDVKHATKIDTLAQAFKVFGEEISVGPVLDFQILPMADGLSIAQLQNAETVFRTLLETAAGGPSNARKAFDAWLRFKAEEPLSESQRLVATQWDVWLKLALTEGRSKMDNPSVDFIVRRA